MAIIDCFLFNNELELLEIRLHELSSVVDKFVLVEASVTHAGDAKPLHYLNNVHKFRKFKDRITHIIVRDMPDGPDAWKRENFQRNAILRGLAGTKDNDVILISDCDEIPKADRVAACSVVKRLWAFEQELSYYHVNRYTENAEPWHGTLALPYSLMKVTMPQVVRDQRNNTRLTVFDGGWHYSYLGGAERITSKIKSFAHQEYNTPERTDEEYIQEDIFNSRDLFTPGKKWLVRPLTKEDCPEYLWDNREKFSHLIAG